MENLPVCEQCDTISDTTVKNIIGSNYEIIKELENILNIIAMEIRKTDVPEINDALPCDLIGAVYEHNKLLVRCLDHARYIKSSLGIGDL